MDDAVKRAYSSPLREQAAARTRRLIREAATELFTERGYVATTVRDVAAAAGVAPRTVFATYAGGKLAIFRDALGVAIAGDEDATPLADRPEFAALADDPDRLVGAVVAFSADLLDRAGPLIVAMIESAGADPDMRLMEQEGAEATAANLMHVAAALSGHGMLAEGLDVHTATDVLVTLLSPHVHDLLRRRRGWSSATYRRWLERTLTEQIVAR